MKRNNFEIHLTEFGWIIFLRRRSGLQAVSEPFAYRTDAIVALKIMIGDESEKF